MRAPETDIYTELLAKGISPAGAALVEGYVHHAEKCERSAGNWAAAAQRKLDEARELERRVAVWTLAVVAIHLATLLVELLWS